MYEGISTKFGGNFAKESVLILLEYLEYVLIVPT